MDHLSIKFLLDHFKANVERELNKIVTAISASSARPPPPPPLPVLSSSAMDKNSSRMEPKVHESLANAHNQTDRQPSPEIKMIRNSTPNLNSKSFINDFGETDAVPSPVPNSTKFNYVKVSFSEYIPVQPSFIYSSRNMYMHLDYSQVENFSIDLNEKYRGEDRRLFAIQPAQIQPNMLYCVLNQADENYYRARITGMKGADKFRVLLVDFGEFITVESDKIFSLAAEFMNAPIYAVNCFLDGEWKKSYKYVENFLLHFFSKDDLGKTEVKAKFFKPVLAEKYPISLILRVPNQEWLNIFEFIKKHFSQLPIYDQVKKFAFNFNDFKINNSFLEYSSATLTAYNRSLKTSLASIATNLIFYRAYRAFCPYAFSSSHFICVLKSFDDEPDICDPFEFTTNMSYFYQNSVFDHMTNIKPESLVIFKLGNVFFFRGFVLSYSSSSGFVDLLSLDYGFLTQAPDSDVFPILEMFTLEKYPIFSLLCSLDDVNPKDELTSTELFRNLVNGQELDVKPVTIYYAKGQYAVKLSMDGLDINEALKNI